MTTKFDLKGKRALVTGSTQGIGFAAADILTAHGAEVFVHGTTSQEKCKKAAERIGGLTKSALADLYEATCADELYEQTGDVDILVLNASIQIRKAWDEITLEEYERQMNINFRSNLLLIQKYVPYMKAQKWGRIICVGSVQQYKPHKDMLVYAASKQAQMSMVNNLAKQLAPYGITVNNVSPGVIATPRNDEALSDEEYMKNVLNGIPSGFIAEPSDCAGGVLLLASEAGRYITGIDLTIDGGMRL